MRDVARSRIILKFAPLWRLTAMNFIRSLRLRAGALLYDWPRYRRSLRDQAWIAMRNRNERLTPLGAGMKCEWKYSSELHLPRVFPRTGSRLLAAAFAQWPVSLREEPASTASLPDVSFIIGHRGAERLPLLLATLRSIAGQTDVAWECVVVEESVRGVAPSALPAWVRAIRVEVDEDAPYNRSASFNRGAAEARGSLLIFHDNDMLIPARYAAEVARVAAEGYDAIDLKRFLFDLGNTETARVTAGDMQALQPSAVRQNLRGGSTALSRSCFERIGGFDEEFVGWGGEDNDLWDRAETAGKSFPGGYLPMLHLHHAPQPGKTDLSAPALRRYHEVVAKLSPEERIERLRARRR